MWRIEIKSCQRNFFLTYNNSNQIWICNTPFTIDLTPHTVKRGAFFMKLFVRLFFETWHYQSHPLPLPPTHPLTSVISLKYMHCLKQWIGTCNNYKKFIGVLLWILIIIMQVTMHKNDFTLNAWTKNTGIMFLQYIYLVKNKFKFFDSIYFWVTQNHVKLSFFH